MRSRCGAGAKRRRRGSGERAVAGPFGTTRGRGGRRPGETRGGFRWAPAARASGAWSNGGPAPDGASMQTRTAHAVQAEVQARAGRSGAGGPGLAPRRPNLGMPDRPRNWEKGANRALAGRHSACRGLRKVHFRTHGGGVPAALTLGVWLLATPAADLEPGLLETQEAAARTAGGAPAPGASRGARGPAPHPAPPPRGQAAARRDGETPDRE